MDGRTDRQTDGQTELRLPTALSIARAVKTDHFVKNSQHIAADLASLSLNKDDMLVSHDVVSIFTNMPTGESLKVITERLEKDPEWKDRCLLEVKDILELLEFIISTTYFTFRGQLCRQKFGTAMGSPVSPLMASMNMEHLEEKLQSTAPLELKPKP